MVILSPDVVEGGLKNVSETAAQTVINVTESVLTEEVKDVVNQQLD